MKKVYKVWVDGEYITPKKARKLHPEGFDTTFTRTEYIDTIPEKIRKNAGRFIGRAVLWLLFYGLIGVEVVLILKHIGLI